MVKSRRPKVVSNEVGAMVLVESSVVGMVIGGGVEVEGSRDADGAFVGT
jgi:hypothetical protein